MNLRLKRYLKRVIAFYIAIIFAFLSIDNVALALSGIFGRNVELSYLYKNDDGTYVSVPMAYEEGERIVLAENPDFLSLNDGESVVAYKLVLLNRPVSELADYIARGNSIIERDFSEYRNATPSEATVSDADATPSDATPSDATPSDATPSDATPSDATPSEATLSDADFVIYDLGDEYIYKSGEYDFEFFREIFSREEFNGFRNLNFAFIPITFLKKLNETDTYISYRISNNKNFILEYEYLGIPVSREGRNSYDITFDKTSRNGQVDLRLKYNEDVEISKTINFSAMISTPEIDREEIVSPVVSPTPPAPPTINLLPAENNNMITTGKGSALHDDKFQFELKGYAGTWTRTIPKWEFKNIENKLVYYKIWNTSLGRKESSAQAVLYKGENIPIDADGIYVLKVWWEDEKGNKYEETTKEIKIDRFAPEIEVSYNASKISDSKYYNKEVVADVKIIEGNFDASRVNISVINKKTGKKFTPEYKFTSNNGINLAKIYLKESGTYSISVSASDLADRQAKMYEGETFTLDLESPKLSIFGVDNLSSNKEVPKIKILYSDENIDRIKTNISLKSMSSKKKYELKGKSDFTFGSYKVDDLGKLADDTYLLEANIYDLAGNLTSKSLVFSVNTKGATFLFKPTELIGEYTNKNFVPKIEVWNTEEVSIISATINGVEESYSYIDGELVFNNEISKEGKYIFNLEVVDTAGNKSNMPTVELILDKTAPTIVVDGLEEDKVYKKKVEFIVSTLNKQDSIQNILLNGKEFKDYKDLKDGSKKFIFNKDGAYNLKVEAIDKAGNKSMEELSFSIDNSKETPINITNKKDNKSLIIVITSFVFIGICLGVYLLIRKRRK